MVVITEALFFQVVVSHRPPWRINLVCNLLCRYYPLGTATPSEDCGVCHQAIYREYAFGFGSDLAIQGYCL